MTKKLSPNWENVITGQINCQDAVRRSLAFTSPEGKAYQLNPVTATNLSNYSLTVFPKGASPQVKSFTAATYDPVTRRA